MTDWNVHGNLLFFFGSIGYVIGAVWYMQSCCVSDGLKLSLSMAVLFVVDSYLYLAGALTGAHARAPRPQGAVALFRSLTNWYMVASLLFVAGSLVYLAAALLPFAWTSDQESSVELQNRLNVAGGAIFIVDSLCYLASGLQHVRVPPVGSPGDAHSVPSSAVDSTFAYTRMTT